MVGNLVDNACSGRSARRRRGIVRRGESFTEGATLARRGWMMTAGPDPLEDASGSAARQQARPKPRPVRPRTFERVDLAALYGGALTLGTGTDGGLREEWLLPAADCGS